MILIGFIAAYAREIAIRLVVVFLLGILLSLVLAGTTSYDIDPHKPFVLGLLESVASKNYEAALIVGFMIGVIITTASVLIDATKAMSKAISANTFDQSKIKLPFLYVMVLIAAIFNYPFYIFGKFVKQTLLIDSSIWGGVFAFQLYTSIFLVSSFELYLIVRNWWCREDDKATK